MELLRAQRVSFGLMLGQRGEGEARLREGRRPRAVARVQEIPDLLPRDPLRLISTWSLAILATIGVGFVLYVGREVLLPVMAAFIVGVMLGPAASRLEALRVPRPLAALLLVFGVTLIVGFVIALILPRVSELTDSLPTFAASLKEKLHIFDGLVASSIVLFPRERSRRITTLSRFLCPASPGFRRQYSFCCRRLPVFCFFSLCSFSSSQNGLTCVAAWS